MRFFRFCKWVWKKNDPFNRSVIGFFLFFCFPALIANIWLGSKAILIVATGMFTILGGWILYGIVYVCKEIWEQFNDEEPTEEIAIMRKLKGIPTPSKEKTEIYYD